MLKETAKIILLLLDRFAQRLLHESENVRIIDGGMLLPPAPIMSPCFTRSLMISFIMSFMKNLVWELMQNTWYPTG